MPNDLNKTLITIDLEYNSTPVKIVYTMGVTTWAYFTDKDGCPGREGFRVEPNTNWQQIQLQKDVLSAMCGVVPHWVELAILGEFRPSQAKPRYLSPVP